MVEKPDTECIDKIFNCMKEFYGDRWSKQFSKSQPEDVFKTMWLSALVGCSYAEIRAVLILLKRAAQNPSAKPPHHLEFWKFTKGYSLPLIIYEVEQKKSNPEVARSFLDEINSKLRFRPHKVLRETCPTNEQLTRVI